MADNGKPKARSSSVRRRNFIRAVGGIGAASVVAGCSGDDQSTEASPTDDDTETGSGGDELVDETFEETIAVNPSNHQWSPFNASSSPEYHVQRWTQSKLAAYDSKGEEWIPLLAEDWEVTSDKFEFTLRDDTQWWPSGNEIVAQDYVTGKRLDWYLAGGNDTWESVEVIDDKTARMTPIDPINPEIEMRNEMRWSLRAPDHIFGEYLTRMEEAEGDQEALDEVRQELGSLSIGNDEAYGSGVFKLVDANAQEMIFEPNEGHFGGRDLNFSRFKATRTNNTDQEHRMLLNDQLDGRWTINNLTEEVANDLPDNQELFQMPLYGGWGLVFNHDDEVYGDPLLHKAFAHMLDFSKFHTTGYSLETIEGGHFTGYPKSYVGQYLSQDVLDGMEDYFDVDHEAATSYLEEAGFSQEGDTWIDPTGSEFSVTIKTAPSRDSVARGVATFIDNFGIPTEVISTEQVWDQLTTNDYTCGIWDWGRSGGTHPLIDQQVPWTGWLSEFINAPAEVEVPPMGQPDGARETTNVADILSEAELETGDDLVPYLEELGWIYNQTLPSIPLVEIVNYAMVDLGDWDIGDLDATHHTQGWLTPYIVNAQLGTLQARTE